MILIANLKKIQQINDTEVFTLILPKEVSFIDVLFNSSYRKILDNEAINYESYKEFEINYDLIEENMTELLLKNKKILNDEVKDFSYNNEVFGNKVANLFTLFRERYNQKNILLVDKVDIYKFSQENKNNIILCKNMINDFITLIEILNEKRKPNSTQENDITEDSKIYELIDKKKDSFSTNFMKMFQNNDSLTIDKTYEIFEYYLKLIYEDIKSEIKRYQKNLDKKSIEEEIKEIYSKENIIDKKSLAHAIRIFITLVLFLEEDKEKKIKSNLNNVMNYLKSVDLWDKNIYENGDFNSNLNNLKLLNVHINQIIYLYDSLGRDIEDNYFDDVKKQIEKEKEKEKEKASAQKISEKEESGKKEGGNKWDKKSQKDESDEEVEEKPEKDEGSDDEEESEEKGGGRWDKKDNGDDDEDDE